MSLADVPADVLVTIGVIVFLLLLSALFSLSETGLTAASRLHIHQLAKEGSRRAKIAVSLNQHKESLIGTVLLANNLVNILASSLATSILIRFFGNRGVAYATGIMTALILIISEVLPKTSQAQIAISSYSERWFLLGASPDLRAQIEATPELHPHATGSLPRAG